MGESGIRAWGARGVVSAVVVALALSVAGCSFLRQPAGTGSGTRGGTVADTSAVATPVPDTSVATVTRSEPPATNEQPPVSTPGGPSTTGLHKPGFDSPERKAILDALRPALQNALKQKVVFKVDRLRVMDGFAFLQAQPLRPDEKPIDYSRTQYADAYASGAFDDRVDALVRWNGERWRVVKWVLGATDVAWENWPDETGAPPDLFEP